MSEISQRSLLSVTSESDLEGLSRDHFEHGSFSILTDGFNVWLGEQLVGEEPKQKIKIPKQTFDYLIRRYVAPQK